MNSKLFGCLLLATVGATACTASTEPTADTAANLVENGETPIIVCRENVDHGAEVLFFAAGPERTIDRAEYTETTFVETKVVADMRVCSGFRGGPSDDSIVMTHRCNDVSWVDSFSADLYEGGFSGLPSVKLYKTVGNTGETVLLHALPCHYVMP
jgi:hypothetical protein